MDQFQFNQDADARRGWAHKLLFIGITFGVILIVGLGLFAYTSQLPVDKQGSGASGSVSRGDDEARNEMNDDSSQTAGGNSKDDSNDGGWLGWLFGAGKRGSAVTDSSTGMVGMKQSFNVLLNDRPTPGAKFILSSFQLKLVDNPVPGSILSPNKLTVHAPDEGLYRAQGDGTIEYTPNDTFVGAARGVGYEIKDTAGVTFTNVYKPSVMSQTNPPVSSHPTTPVVTTCTSEPSGSHLMSRNVRVDTPTEPFTSTTNLQTFETDLIRYSSEDGSRMMVADDEGGIWYTHDSGASWESRNPDLQGIFYYNGAQVSRDGQRVLMTSSTYDEDSETSVQLNFISSDGGQTYTQFSLPVAGDGFISLSDDGSKMVTRITNDDSTGTTLYASDDSGVTWVTGKYYDFATDSPGDPFFLGDNQTIMIQVYDTSDYSSRYEYSTDLGATSQEFTFGIPGRDYTSFEVRSDGQLWALKEMFGNGLDISIDGGNTWVTRTVPGFYYIQQQKISGNRIIVTGISDVDYVSSLLAVSDDFGATWRELPYPGGESEGHSIGQVYNATDDGRVIVDVSNNDWPYNYGIFITSDDGQNWRMIPSLIEVTMPIDVSHIDINPETPGVQTTFDATQKAGWRAEYDPNTDILSITVTDPVLFEEHEYTIDTALQYRVTTSGCDSSAAGFVYINYGRNDS